MTRFLSVPALFALLFVLSCHRPVYLQEQHHQYYSVRNDTLVDSVMLGMIRPYKTGVDTQMQLVIGHAAIPLSKAQPESTLGNFMADAQLETARRIDPDVSISVMNYGGIRLPYIASGPLTKGKMYELMPFDNMLTIIDIPGSVLRQFCDHMARAGGWPVTGISFTIKNKKATDILINGVPPEDTMLYKVALSDYIAGGGDHCNFLLPLPRKNTGILIRDAMIVYVMNLSQQDKALHPVLADKIKYAE